MCLAEDKLEKAINSCQRALDNLKLKNKRLAVGDLDYAEHYIEAVKWILINEIKDEEGEF